MSKKTDKSDTVRIGFVHGVGCVDEPLAARGVVDTRGEVSVSGDSLDFEPLVG